MPDSVVMPSLHKERTKNDKIRRLQPDYDQIQMSLRQIETLQEHHVTIVNIDYNLILQLLLTKYAYNMLRKKADSQKLYIQLF